MSQPNNQVFIGFALEAAGLGDFFTLDDPDKGKLDNTDFKLADPDVLVEVSEDVRSIRTRRGRSRELEKFNAGSIDIVLSNANRKYDPTNARATGTRQNLIPNPSFEADLVNWSTGQSFFTIGPITRQNLISNPSFEASLAGWSTGQSFFTIGPSTPRVNLVTNPSFETSLAGWTTNATEQTTAGAVATQSTTEVFAGSFSAQVETTLSTQGLSLTLQGLNANTTYRISAYLYPEFGDKARLLARDIINDINATPSAFATAQAWTRVDTTLTTGATSGFILDTDLLDTGSLGTTSGVDVVISLVGEEAGVSSFTLDSPTDGLLDTNTLGPEPGARFWVDAVMVEEVATLEPYFDGTYVDPSVSDGTVSWDGTPNLSTSQFFWANLPTIAQDNSLAEAGSNSAETSLFTRFANQGIWNSVTGLQPDTTYTISTFAYVQAGSAVKLSTRDTANSVSGTTSATTGTASWVRLDSQITTGPSAPTVLVAVYTDADFFTSGSGPFSVFNIDAVLVEETATLEPYFDGTYRDSSLNDATSAWDGTTDLSTSTLTWANVPTITRVGTPSRFGTSSAEVEIFTRYAGQGIFTTVSGLAANTTHTISLYAYVASGSAVKLSTRDTTNGISGTTSSVTGSASFVRIDSQVTTGAGVADVLVAVFTDADFLTPGAGPYSTFYIDAVLVEATDTVKDYFDGNVADPAILLPVTSWAGTANNSISNLIFSIPGTGSPFFPEVVPRKQVRFTSNGQEVFDGIIDDWNFSYEILGDATAQVIGTDAFAILSLTNIVPHSAPEQSTGARIAAILTRPEVNWPVAKQQIAAGTATVAAQDIGGTGAQARAVPTLNYLQQVELAEAGALFINKDGAVEFDARTGSQGVPSVRFTDDGTGLPFTDINIDYGTEEMKNRISVYREGSNTQVTAENLNSINRFGPFDYEITDSLLATDAAAEDFALYVLGKYGEPALRIDSISVVLNELDNAQLGNMLALELSDAVQIKFTPERVGNPIEQVVVIDSIEHSVSPVDHVITLNFSESAIGFILDDAEYGVLNTSELGF